MLIRNLLKLFLKLVARAKRAFNVQIASGEYDKKKPVNLLNGTEKVA